ncbi:MAG: TonB family protein [Acidobacteriota bacterium]
MFIESLIASHGKRRKGTRPVSFTIAIAVHAAVVSLLIVIPLLQSSPLPKPAFVVELRRPPEPPPPPPPPPPPFPASTVSEPPRPSSRIEAPPPAPEKLRAPDQVPQDVDVSEIDLGIDSGVPDGVPGGVTGGVVGGVVGSPTGGVVAGEQDLMPVRLGLDIQPPKLIKKVEPVYPAIAAAARVQCTVLIEATTDIRGRVVDVRVTRSIPMLDRAAVDAVRQWIYSPVMLNGRPQPVIFTVRVEFFLR